MCSLLPIFCISALGPTAWAQNTPGPCFFVAPNGNDAWSGTLADPDPGRTDGPFATVQRALQAVRELRAGSPGLSSPVTVLLRGGYYFLAETLVLTGEDSGTRQSPTVIAAYPGETPVLSGGVPISGWTVDAAGRWHVTLPEVARGEWSFTQLFVNGQRRYRPRLPKDGYYFIARAVPSTDANKGKGCDRFGFRPGQFRADWPDLQDIEVLAFHSWTVDRLRIAHVDEEKRIVTFVAPTPSENWAFDLHAGGRFIIENVRAALDDPGEWYLDRQTGELTYIPLAGEKPEETEVIAPRLETLVRMVGDAELGMGVHHVVFRGITFAHTNWVTPPDGYRWVQSESVLPGAITAQGAQHCALEDCVITHVGAYAVELGAGCKYNRVEGCEITDMAAGGVKIGEMTMHQSDILVASHNVVRNNLIAHGGRMHAAGMGVWIGHSPYNVVEHNEICDFYQTGISVGWSWGYDPSLAHHNTIAYNRIYHLGQGVTDDMGGIYTLGVSPGTVLHHNIIHDVSCHHYGGRGIYFDEGSSEILAENNLVYRTDSGAFMQHYGRENRVINNIFALARGGQLDRLREEEHISFEFRRNIVYYDSTGFLLYENWSNDRFIMDENLYWDASGRPVMFGAETFEQWQARGHDRNSIIADPLFVDPANGDFRLREGSPAQRIGFVPFDMSTIGRLPPHGPGPERPLAPRAFPPKPGPQPIDEDYEGLAVGELAPGAVVHEENDQATIRVTDETAASGQRCLKLVDQPGQQHNFNPHMYYPTGFNSGVLIGHFDLRWEPPMQFYYEWRDCTVFYRSGPLLRIMPDGALVVNGRELMRIPAGQWVGYDVVCGLGEQATGTWELSVSLPDQPQPRRFQGLTYDPEFRIIHWLLFTCEGEQAAVSYLDNVKLGPKPDA